MIVVDSNVVAALFIPSELSEAAEQLLATDHEWAAPTLWRSEFRNILATYIRVKKLDLETALHIAESAEALFAGREFSVDSGAVLRLAAQSRCTAYDSEFVVLANHLGARLVTIDKELLERFPAIASPLNASDGDA